MQELRFISGSLRLTPRNTRREIGITVIIAFLLLMPPLCRGWQKPMSLQLTTPVLSVNPTLGPPTTTVSVVGTGFDPNSRVEIYFDATVVASAMTDSTGHLVGGSVGGQVSIKVPASAVPGRHWISAIEPLGQKMGRAPFLVRTDWAQFRFAPDHAGANSYENVLTQETVGGLQQRWTYTTSAGIQSSPAVVGGTAYFGSDNGTIYAVQISTGRLLWQHETGSAVDSSPAVANGIVYVGTWAPDDSMYALDAATGVVLWKYVTHGEVFSSPVVANGVVYFGSYDMTLHALNATTGAVIWEHPTSGYILSSPAVANGLVYFTSYCPDCNLYALDAATGNTVWTQRINPEIYSSPAVANGVVYVGGTPDYCLSAFDSASGTPLWKYQTEFWVYSSPAVSGGVVYFGSGGDPGSVYALDARTGSLLWGYATGGHVWSSPAVANGVLYVGSSDGNFYALNASTGSLLWMYPTGEVRSSPAVSDGAIYIGSGTDVGILYSFGLVHE